MQYRHRTAPTIRAAVSQTLLLCCFGVGCDRGLSEPERAAALARESVVALVGEGAFRTWDGGDYIYCTWTDSRGTDFELILRREGAELRETFRSASKRAAGIYSSIVQSRGEVGIAEIYFGEGEPEAPAFYRFRALDQAGVPRAAEEFGLGMANPYDARVTATDFGVVIRLSTAQGLTWYAAEGASPPARVFSSNSKLTKVLGASRKIVAVEDLLDRGASAWRWSLWSQSESGLWREERTGEVPANRRPIGLWRDRVLAEDGTVVCFGDDCVEVEGLGSRVSGIGSAEESELFLLSTEGPAYHIVDLEGRVLDTLHAEPYAGARPFIAPTRRLGTVRWRTDVDSIVVEFIEVIDGEIVRSVASLGPNSGIAGSAAD